MQISLEWLKDYIRYTGEVVDLTKLLTFSGIEVEDVKTFGDIQDSIITAKVIESVLMEGSDHLQICQVDTCTEIIQVVCGAPNCISGINAVLALPGTKLGNLTIKHAHIRGTDSCGMLCSELELGFSDEHKGIIILPQETVIGIPIRNMLKLPDTIFELEITPNRPDLLGYLGIATDISASAGNTLSIPATSNLSLLEDKNNRVVDYLSLKNLDADLCSRYTARVIKDIKVTESPLWLKLRLLKSGFRPINNIVDITNYIMLETGHPLHAFDYDKLEKVKGIPEIVVRRAEIKEVFSALDGKSYMLDSDDLVITDGKNAIALAGVIGGSNSHITESTVNIVLESACFNHSTVRRTAYKHKITTDSAYRFERHLSAENCTYASERASQLIIELASGKLCQGFLDEWQATDKQTIVPLRPNRLKQVIGINLSKEKISNYLTKLGLVYLGEGCYKKFYPDSADKIPKLLQDNNETLYFDVESEDRLNLRKIEPIEEALYFEIPSKRVDLTREIDLIEEVIRLYGMDNVPQRVKAAIVMDRHAFQLKRKASDFLVYSGFQEIVNLSFTDPGLINYLDLKDEDIRLRQITLLNPQNSNLSVMRTSLIPQLLLNAQYNLNHGTKQIKLFELNKVFLENDSLPKSEPLRLSFLWLGFNNDNHWKVKPLNSDFYQLKGIVEDLLKLAGITNIKYSENVSGYLVGEEAQSILYNNDCIAEYGRLKPSIAAVYDIDTVELKQEVWIADIDLEKIVSLSRTLHKSYIPIPRFPSIERDISFLVKDSIVFSRIRDSIIDTHQEQLVDVSLIDEYKGKQVPEGLKSLTFRFIFNNPEKTLTDDEVEAAFASIVNNLKSQWDIQLR